MSIFYPQWLGWQCSSVFLLNQTPTRHSQKNSPKFLCDGRVLTHLHVMYCNPKLCLPKPVVSVVEAVKALSNRVGAHDQEDQEDEDQPISPHHVSLPYPRKLTCIERGVLDLPQEGWGNVVEGHRNRLVEAQHDECVRFASVL